jgi:hypothetical protein
LSTAPTESMWSGNYNNWQEAENQSSGYDKVSILEKIKTSADGSRIERSRRYDHRNKNGELGSTSLIVVAIKQ